VDRKEERLLLQLSQTDAGARERRDVRERRAEGRVLLPQTMITSNLVGKKSVRQGEREESSALKASVA